MPFEIHLTLPDEEDATWWHLGTFIKDEIERELRKEIRSQVREAIQAKQKHITQAIAHRLAKADYLKGLVEEEAG